MWVLIFLIGCSWLDWVKRSIPVWLLSFASVVVGMFRICHWEKNTMLWLGGAGVGILFFVVSKFTKEAIGYADSWMILLLGIYLGLWDILWLLSISLIISGIVAVILLIKFKYSRKIAFPFIPFLAIAYIGVMWL